MQIPIFHSILTLKPEDVFQTNGSHPVLVHADDLEYYVTKYPRRTGDPILLNEYLSAAFLRQWGLGVPAFAFVKVLPEHIPPGLHPRIQPYFFRNTCFGLHYGRYFDEVTKLLEAMSDYQKNLFIRKEELLEIALFDLWLSNEDRNANNYNLLCDVTAGFRFVPIDHQAVFNHGHPGGKLSLITESESLIGTPLFRSLFTSKEISAYGTDERVKKKFYLCIEKCAENLALITSRIPVDWKADPEQLAENLRKTIFEEVWKKQVWSTFLEYLQIANNHS